MPKAWGIDFIDIFVEWFTFLTYPEVKPDNNDAERALRPVVIHLPGQWWGQKWLGSWGA